MLKREYLKLMSKKTQQINDNYEQMKNKKAFREEHFIEENEYKQDRDRKRAKMIEEADAKANMIYLSNSSLSGKSNNLEILNYLKLISYLKLLFS